MKVFTLMTQWKDGDPEYAGTFSTFDRAVRYFVRTHFQDSGLKGPGLRSECARAALQIAGETEDDDRADFGDTRAWIEEEELDERCEAFEKEARDDS